MIARLYVEGDLAERQAVDLDQGQAHHLRSVLRLRPGAPVRLFNGRDGEWSARLESLAKHAAVARVEERRRRQEAGPDLWLLFAPLKRAPLHILAEKATELGVRALLPVLTKHTAVGGLNQARLRATAVEAAEQCERLDVPMVHEARPLGDVIVGWPPARRLMACVESGQAQPLADLLRDAAQSDAKLQQWAVLIGPEGGFAAPEVDLLSRLPYCSLAGLGPRILRAETAAIAAVACWQAILGDGARRPPPRFGDPQD
jgi:16S rRNA (uracil1498-N3)-methyltransferase